MCRNAYADVKHWQALRCRQQHYVSWRCNVIYVSFRSKGLPTCWCLPDSILLARKLHWFSQHNQKISLVTLVQVFSRYSHPPPPKKHHMKTSSRWFQVKDWGRVSPIDGEDTYRNGMNRENWERAEGEEVQWWGGHCTSTFGVRDRGEREGVRWECKTETALTDSLLSSFKDSESRPLTFIIVPSLRTCCCRLWWTPFSCSLQTCTRVSIYCWHPECATLTSHWSQGSGEKERSKTETGSSYDMCVFSKIQLLSSCSLTCCLLLILILFCYLSLLKHAHLLLLHGNHLLVSLNCSAASLIHNIPSSPHPYQQHQDWCSSPSVQSASSFSFLLIRSPPWLLWLC